MKWARLRFSIIGELLASPPEPGQLRGRLEQLAARTWQHPTTGEPVRFGVSTLERWLYLARKHPEDPFGALARKVRKGAGQRPSVGPRLEAALRKQYAAHPKWSYKLHHDNLRALVRSDPPLGPLPSYTTLTRFMKERGMTRRRRRRKRDAAAPEIEPREQRLFEVSHVGGLWHFDFHPGSRHVLTPDGKWNEVKALGVLDDKSRACGHLQWYTRESAETLCHTLRQAILKRGLPRAVMSDNGTPMLAAETTQGLERLGILHHTTLPYHPEQNAKQETFWDIVEGRLMAMLEGERELTLELLGRATQAWVEQDYHRSVHEEIGMTPLEAFVAGPSVMRPSPCSDALRRAFRRQETRTQRRSDGTLTVQGVRFEVPAAYRTLVRPTVRFAHWDLSSIDLVDPRTSALLRTLYPVDKQRNADRRRRAIRAEPQAVPEPEPASGIAPLLEQMMADYAATGLPPAYLPHGGDDNSEDDDD